MTFLHQLALLISTSLALKSFQDFMVASSCLSSFKVNVSTLKPILFPHPCHLPDLVLTAHTRAPPFRYLRIILLTFISMFPVCNFFVIRYSQFKALEIRQVYSTFPIQSVTSLSLTWSIPRGWSQHHASHKLPPPNPVLAKSLQGNGTNMVPRDRRNGFTVGNWHPWGWRHGSPTICSVQAGAHAR